MKSAILFTSSSPILVLTSFQSFEDQKFLDNLAHKGIGKCICFEVPIETVKARYGFHFDMVCEDLAQTDELRIMDADGSRIFALFDLGEFGPPIFITLTQETATF